MYICINSLNIYIYVFVYIHTYIYILTYIYIYVFFVLKNIEWYWFILNHILFYVIIFNHFIFVIVFYSILTRWYYTILSDTVVLEMNILTHICEISFIIFQYFWEYIYIYICIYIYTPKGGSSSCGTTHAVPCKRMQPRVLLAQNFLGSAVWPSSDGPRPQGKIGMKKGWKSQTNLKSDPNTLHVVLRLDFEHSTLLRG